MSIDPRPFGDPASAGPAPSDGRPVDGLSVGAMSAVHLLPSVDVVIPTRQRPELLRAAIRSVREQDYAGPLRIFVVFDGCEPDTALATDTGVPVTVIVNDRKPGLCGTRNTGILAGDGEWVAFLDDDDRWLPGKLSRQVERLAEDPDALFVSTSVRIEFGDDRNDRFAGQEVVTHEQLLVSRMAMLHSSTFLIRREALLGRPGLVDETAPEGQNEDWDLLLRYSAVRPIAHLDVPLVAVRWGTSSLFAQAWRSKLDGALWALERHPDIATSPRGHARVLGQIAFAQAGVGEHRAALATAVRALRIRRGEPRAYLAVLAALGVPTRLILHLLHKRGRGV